MLRTRWECAFLAGGFARLRSGWELFKLFLPQVQHLPTLKAMVLRRGCVSSRTIMSRVLCGI